MSVPHACSLAVGQRFGNTLLSEFKVHSLCGFFTSEFSSKFLIVFQPELPTSDAQYQGGFYFLPLDVIWRTHSMKNAANTQTAAAAAVLKIASISLFLGPLIPSVYSFVFS